MKKMIFAFISIFALTLFAGTIAMAQQTEKELKKEIKEKAIKSARKDAKKIKKDGWDVAPGSLPLDKTLENSWMKSAQMTEDGSQPRYITADGEGFAGTRTAAEMQAVETAKLQLAGQLETKIASLVSANIANNQTASDEAATITEVIQSAKNIIAQELGVVSPFFKIYRTEAKNERVRVRLFYDTQQAMTIAKKKVLQELKDKTKQNEEDLKKLMGM